MGVQKDRAAIQPMATHRRLPVEAWWCLAVLAVLDLCALIQKLLSLRGHSVHSPADLSQTMHRGYDLLGFADRFRTFGTPAFFDLGGQGQFNYPAPMAIVLAALFRMPGGAVRIFNLLLVAFLSLVGALFVRACRRRGIGLAPAAVFTVALLLLSFPVQLLWFMSNAELFVWIVVAAGLWAWFTNRSWLAVLCFGLAGSLKYFPLTFLGLFSLRREWHKILAGVVVCAVSIVTSLAIMGPTIPAAAAGLRRSAALFTGNYLQSFRPVDSGFDHSLFALLKVLLVQSGHLDVLPRLLQPYLLLMAITLLALYLLRIQHLPAPNRLLALTIFAVTAMPISQEYTLIHLFAPLAVILLAMPGSRFPATLSLRLAFLCFGILFAALFLGASTSSLQFGGQAKCLLLLFLLALSLRRDLLPSTSYPADRL